MYFIESFVRNVQPLFQNICTHSFHAFNDPSAYHHVPINTTRSQPKNGKKVRSLINSGDQVCLCLSV